jgi:hypothetical protein
MLIDISGNPAIADHPERPPVPAVKEEKEER